MTISQKRAIYYAFRKEKFIKFMNFIHENDLIINFYLFRKLNHYVYPMNYIRFFCEEENIIYNSRSKKYEKRA